LPWLSKHNPVIDWTTLSIQFAPSLRAMTFQPARQGGTTIIEELPRDEPDAIGEAPDDPRVILEDTREETPVENISTTPAWDQATKPPEPTKEKNSKQRKR
ncbi:uncharacterized protein SCHCODRAFT_01048368, partial [Schizophyllum commune H4-8]|uniref:uncharacterized protein n=1 Tax=Schizophyllum commune (strain H4-8 / FGSC 9210) TaxID=578458 RepID=UPI00216010ED